MSSYIYLEGGASGPHSKELRIRCQRAFHKLLRNMGFRNRMPHLIACGGRDNAYNRFCTELGRNAHDYVALWVDSEDPVSNIDHTWAHLARVTTVSVWPRPAGADDDQVLLMTTCMETWILADRHALSLHYKKNLDTSKLLPTNGLENRLRHDVHQSLTDATKSCSNAYSKGKRSFDVLEKVDPAVLWQYLPSFARVKSILSQRL